MAWVQSFDEARVNQKRRQKTDSTGSAGITTNTPFFGAPGNSLGTPQFGLINSAGDARIIQVALKAYF